MHALIENVVSVASDSPILLLKDCSSCHLWLRTWSLKYSSVMNTLGPCDPRLTGLNICRSFIFSSRVCNYALLLCLISGRYSPPQGCKTVSRDFLLLFSMMPKYTFFVLVTGQFLLDPFKKR